MLGGSTEHGRDLRRVPGVTRTIPQHCSPTSGVGRTIATTAVCIIRQRHVPRDLQTWTECGGTETRIVRSRSAQRITRRHCTWRCNFPRPTTPAANHPRVVPATLMSRDTFSWRPRRSTSMPAGRLGHVPSSRADRADRTSDNPGGLLVAEAGELRQGEGLAPVGIEPRSRSAVAGASPASTRPGHAASTVRRSSSGADAGGGGRGRRTCAWRSTAATRTAPRRGTAARAQGPQIGLLHEVLGLAVRTEHAHTCHTACSVRRTSSTTAALSPSAAAAAQRRSGSSGNIGPGCREPRDPQATWPP